VSLLRRPATTASGSSVGAVGDVPGTHFGARLDLTGLCQQRDRWSTSIPCSAAPVGLERFSALSMDFGDTVYLYLYGLTFVTSRMAIWTSVSGEEKPAQGL
jgi:hypothetical protein